MYYNRKYIIFSTSELDKINFDEVFETSAETVRKSLNQTKTFVKWDGDEIPSSVQTLQTKTAVYNHQQILEILSTDEWVERAYIESLT
jgi:hypothetical protein